MFKEDDSTSRQKMHGSTHTAQKMKFSEVSYGYGHIYWRNL